METNGRVTSRLGPVLNVEADDGDQVPCRARGRGKAAVVGDRIHFDPDSGDEFTRGIVTAVGERTSLLSRTDPHRVRPLAIAANVDRIFAISAFEPPMREGLIDRYLVAAHAAGIEALIVLNKVELIPADDASFEARLTPYHRLGYRVIGVSAHTGWGLDTLREAFADHLSILVGHSGVGKTSLLNALVPGLDERVAALSEASGRGQHTTTATAMFELPTGGHVIDSPGIRSFGLWGVSPEALRGHWIDFVPFADECKFANCSHTHEPGCAVVDALDAGDIDPGRYDSYVRILESLLEDSTQSGSP